MPNCDPRSLHNFNHPPFDCTHETVWKQWQQLSPTNVIDCLLVFLLQAETESDLNIRTYGGGTMFSCLYFYCCRHHLPQVFSPFFFISVGFRNHAAADTSCHSDRLLQQMDEGRRQRGLHRMKVIYWMYWMCNLNSSFTLFQRWPTVQDLAAATLEVITNEAVAQDDGSLKI